MLPPAVGICNHFRDKVDILHSKKKKKSSEWSQLAMKRDSKNRSPAVGQGYFYSCVPIHLDLTSLSKLSGFIICKISQLSFQRALEASF